MERQRENHILGGQSASVLIVLQYSELLMIARKRCVSGWEN